MKPVHEPPSQTPIMARAPGANLGRLPPLSNNGVTVSVIMPVRNESSFIERSLRAVLEQDVDLDKYQVIVVDGGSTDGTPDLVRGLLADSSVRSDLIVNLDRIVPISLNRGLEVSDGDVIIRVDGHCVIEPDYVTSCLAVLWESGAACAGGPMRTIGSAPTADSIALAQSSWFGVGGARFRTSEKPGPVDTVAFGAYRREVFERIGVFDESLVRNQDDEFNLRLTRAGGVIWMDPRIRSQYFSRASIGGLARQYHGYGYYKVAVMRKHRTVPSVRHLVPALFVLAVLAGLLRLLLGRPRPLIGLILAYGTTNAAAAARSGASLRKIPKVMTATTTMHLFYGLGTIRGMLEGVQRRGWK